ncbi:hypothetical protein QUF63_04275 [Anaerolineales bacterium HSG25]|nr:hypothetical protein [Anaerolineales bacterium HSG25]
MNLVINKQPQKFIPIQKFRTEWQLSDEFGVAYFEPKDWQELGSMKGTGEAMALLKKTVLDAVPPALTMDNLLSCVDILTNSYQYQLQIANHQIGLRLHDVGFATAGFEDVIRSVTYNLLQLNHTYQGDIAQIQTQFNFSAVYHAWLADSVRVSATVHEYSHGDQLFQIRIVNHIYGRVGLEVVVEDEVYYLLDKELACPGENFMYYLCQDVAKQLCHNLTV